jgi:hypothetical protein
MYVGGCPVGDRDARRAVPHPRPVGRPDPHPLCVPANLPPIALPPYPPDLNPVKRLWLYLREHHWSNRVYEDIEALEAAAEAVTPTTEERHGCTLQIACSPGLLGCAALMSPQRLRCVFVTALPLY